MRNQLNRGLRRRLMYIENKDGLIDGCDARIGWVTFSRSGQSVRYRGRELSKGVGAGGNFFDVENGGTYWVSGVKRRGSNVHPCESAAVEIDDDALDAYKNLRGGRLEG